MGIDMAMQATKLSFIMTRGFLFLNLLEIFIPRFLMIKLIYIKKDIYKLIINVFKNINTGSVIYALINSICVSTSKA
jgi:hypothetical protein